MLTSRDRPKSAPYPRLKNSKRTSKCQFTVLENRKTKKSGPSGSPGPANAAPGALKGGGGTSETVNIFVAVEGGTLRRKNKFSKKSLTMPKNRKGDPSGFLNTHSVAKHQKIEGGNLFSEKKSRSAEKN